MTATIALILACLALVGVICEWTIRYRGWLDDYKQYDLINRNNRFIAREISKLKEDINSVKADLEYEDTSME